MPVEAALVDRAVAMVLGSVVPVPEAELGAAALPVEAVELEPELERVAASVLESGLARAAPVASARGLAVWLALLAEVAGLGPELSVRVAALVAGSGPELAALEPKSVARVVRVAAPGLRPELAVRLA